MFPHRNLSRCRRHKITGSNVCLHHPGNGYVHNLIAYFVFRAVLHWQYTDCWIRSNKLIEEAGFHHSKSGQNHIKNKDKNNENRRSN